MKFLNKFIYIFFILFILFIFCKFGTNNFVETFENNYKQYDNNQKDFSKISFSKEDYPLEVYPASVKSDLINTLAIYENSPNKAFQIIKNKKKYLSY